MSEELGQALLYLRTDDRGLTAGIKAAHAKSDQLGVAFDTTSDKATKMGGAMRGAGAEAGAAGAKTGEYSREVAKLKAMLDPAWGSLQKFRQEAIVARQALDAGAISHKQYVEALRQSATQAGVFTTAGAKVTQMSGAQRAGVNQLMMQVNDMGTMYSLGARPMQIFTSQMGQVLQAVQLASGGTSRFAAIMGSPWTMAMGTAAIVLLPLIANLFESGDAAEDSGKKNLSLSDALKKVETSTGGAMRALKDYNAERDRDRKNTEAMIKLNLADAEAKLKSALATRKLLEAELARREDAARQFQLANPESVGADLGASMTRSQLEENKANIEVLEQTIRNLRIDDATRDAKAAVDPIVAINNRYDEMAEAAKRAAAGNDALAKSLKATLTQIERQRKAALDAANAQKRADRNSQSNVGDATRFISPVSGGVIRGRFGENRGNRNHAGIDIAVPVGTQVKAPADGVVIEAGTVPGYGNVVYIDHGRGTISRLAHLSKIGVSKGDVVSQGNVIGLSGGARGAPGSGNSRGPHLHQEVRVNGRPVDPRGGSFQTDPASAQDKADRIAEQAARAAEEEARRTERFNRDLASLQDAALDLQAQLADTADERYRLEVEGLDVALAEHRRRIDANSDYSEAQKAELRAALAVKESLERELLDRRRREELARQSLEIAQAMNANEATLLQKQLQLADTREDRRAIDQQLLDLEYEARKRALEFRIKDPKNDPADQWAAFDELSKLEQNRSLDQRRLDREYESPIERWRRELIGYGDNLNDELEKVAVGALDSIADRLANIAFNARNAMDAIVGIFKQIGVELVALFIKQQLILPLLNMLGIGGGGGGGGFFGSLFGAGLSLLGGGGGKSGNGASAAKAAGKFAGFFAEGGLIPNGSFGIVGEAGPELAFGTGGGLGVLPNSALRAMGQGNAGDTYFDLRGAVMTEDLLRQMNAMSQAHARGAVAEYNRGIGGHVQENLARRG